MNRKHSYCEEWQDVIASAHCQMYCICHNDGAHATNKRRYSPLVINTCKYNGSRNHNRVTANNRDTRSTEIQASYVTGRNNGSNRPICVTLCLDIRKYTTCLVCKCFRRLRSKDTRRETMAVLHDTHIYIHIDIYNNIFIYERIIIKSRRTGSRLRTNETTKNHCHKDANLFSN